MERVIIVNDQVVILKENESWNIYANSSRINLIHFTNLSNNVTASIAVESSNRTRIMKIIVDGIKDGNRLIYIDEKS